MKIGTDTHGAFYKSTDKLVAIVKQIRDIKAKYDLWFNYKYAIINCPIK